MSLSLTRRRTALDPPAVASGEVVRVIALDAVDAALRQVHERTRFVRREATRVLDDVRAQVDEPSLGADASRAFDAAVASLGADEIVDRHRLTDALLDIRLAVVRGGR